MLPLSSVIAAPTCLDKQADLKEAALVKSLNVFSTWQGKGKSLALSLSKPDTKAGVIYLVNKDGAAQSAIRIGKRSITQDITGEYYKSYLMNFALGVRVSPKTITNINVGFGMTESAPDFLVGFSMPIDIEGIKPSL